MDSPKANGNEGSGNPTKTPGAEVVAAQPALEAAGTPGSEDAQRQDDKGDQEVKTLQGRFKKLQEENAALRKQLGDFSLVTTQLESLQANLGQLQADVGQSTDLILTHITREGTTEFGEDDQAKVESIKKQQALRQQQQQQRAKAQQAMSEIIKLVKENTMTLDDELLKPARQAYESGNAEGALKLTYMAIGKKQGTVAKPAPAPEPATPAPKPKEKPKVITATPAGTQGWRDLPPREKLKIAVQELHDQQ
jgi:hypothetical protein